MGHIGIEWDGACPALPLLRVCGCPCQRAHCRSYVCAIDKKREGRGANEELVAETAVVVR